MGARNPAAQLLAWEREAVFWREASNDGLPKTDSELEVILDRAGYFEDLVMAAPSWGTAGAALQAGEAP